MARLAEPKNRGISVLPTDKPKYLGYWTTDNQVIAPFDYPVTLPRCFRLTEPKNRGCSVLSTDEPKYLGYLIPSTKVCEFRAELTLFSGEADLPLCIQSAYLAMQGWPPFHSPRDIKYSTTFYPWLLPYQSFPIHGLLRPKYLRCSNRKPSSRETTVITTLNHRINRLFSRWVIWTLCNYCIW